MIVTFSPVRCIIYAQLSVVELKFAWVRAFQKQTKQMNDLKSEIEAIVNRCLEAMATILTKWDVLGVKLQVIEVKKLEFYIYFKKYFKRIDLFLNKSETKV